MAKKESGCLYMVLGLIALAIIFWVLQNIVGLAGLALAGWAGYRFYQKYNNKEQFKLEAVLMSLGLVIGIGWFAISPGIQEQTANNNTSMTSTQNSSEQNSSLQASSQAKQQTTTTSVNSNIGPSAINTIPAIVTSVIDGDTITAAINGKTEKIRLIGIDTPETKDPNKPVQSYGPEASNYTTAQLNGKQVYLELDTSERDRYGRLLAYVWLENPASNAESELQAKMFNAKLLLDGYAQLMTVPPNVKYVNYFTTYQKEARDSNKGLWAVSSSSGTSAASVNTTPSTATQKAAKSPAPSTKKNEITVYVTNTGEKYHRAGCRYLRKSQNPMDLAEAISAGYEACSVCDPPR